MTTTREKLVKACEESGLLTMNQIEHMVQRFLMWKLPVETMSPDYGISIERPSGLHRDIAYEPVGTNLFSYTEAKKMVEYMLADMGQFDRACGYPGSRPSRDETWLRVAEVIAQRGTCARRKVGCVIVDEHGRVMATGYNGPASGEPHCSEGHPCPGAGFRSGEGLDDCEAIHAEQNACLLLDDPWKVDTIYCTASPCVPCVKLLLGTSAKRIVCREIYPHPKAIEAWHRAGRHLIQLGPDGKIEQIK